MLTHMPDTDITYIGHLLAVDLAHSIVELWAYTADVTGEQNGRDTVWLLSAAAPVRLLTSAITD